MKTVGRRAELESTSEALENAAGGKGGAVLLSGEAGIGKTTIVRELVRQGSVRGFSVRQATAYRYDSDRPFGVLLNALHVSAGIYDPRLSDLDRLLRKPSPGDLGPADAQLRFRIIDEIVDVIGTLAGESPLLLVIDDAHWADLSTVRALECLCPQLSRLPMALVMSFRPGEILCRHGQLLEILRKEGALEVAITPLDDEAQRELAQEILQAEPDAALLEKISVAGGNPLHLTVLLEELSMEGAIEMDRGWARVVQPFAPRSLEKTILLQISRLSPQCQRILKVASTLGTRFSVSDLATLSYKNVASLLRFVSEAYDAGILIESDDELSFRHEVVRDVFYRDMPEAVRKALHTDAARQLQEKGAPIARVAIHYALGANPGNKEAASWLKQAAGQISLRCPETAIKLLDRAFALVEESIQDRIQIMTQMLNILSLTGDPKRAESLARELLSTLPASSSTLPISRDLARTLWRQGRVEEAAQVLAELSDLEGLPDSICARLLAETAYLHVRYGPEPDRSTSFALEAKALANRAGDGVAAGMALHVLGRKAWWKGRFARAAALQAEAISIAEEDAQEVQYFTPYQHLALSLIELDRFDEAEGALQAGLAMVHKVGEEGTYFHQYHAIFGYLFGLTGRWKEGAEEFHKHLSAAGDRRGYREAFDAAVSILVHLAVHAGELTLAEKVMAGRDQTIEGAVAALFHVAKGDLDSAHAELSKGPEGRFSRAPIFARLVWPEAVKLAADLGLPGVATILLAEIERIAASNNVATARGAAIRARGLLENDLSALEVAVAVYAESERVFEAASVMEEAGTAQALAGNHDRAKELLVSAMQHYERMGALRDLRRTESFARDLGIARGVRSQRRHAGLGWDSLTRTERKVVSMIAQGMSNKRIAEQLYVSRRTVETHVLHIFRKLGLKARAELAAIYSKRARENDDGLWRGPARS